MVSYTLTYYTQCSDGPKPKKTRLKTNLHWFDHMRIRDINILLSYSLWITIK